MAMSYRPERCIFDLHRLIEYSYVDSWLQYGLQSVQDVYPCVLHHVPPQQLHCGLHTQKQLYQQQLFQQQPPQQIQSMRPQQEVQGFVDTSESQDYAQELDNHLLLEPFHGFETQCLVWNHFVHKDNDIEIRNWHGHNYGDQNTHGKAVQYETPVFVKLLRSKHFPNCEDLLICLRGSQLSLPYFMQNGFDFPILVDSKVGLGLKVPSDTFTVVDVMDYVGPHFPLDVIDVVRQENIRMTMQEWVEYFNSPIRSKVYNVISLEFSQTRLAELVKPPAIVRKLSWVENYWPEVVTFPHVCPQVMKYCIMSTQDSYANFHINFGGTSVWYYVLRGKKVFYIIRPTPANLALYEHWMASPNQSESFFGDQVDVCYQLVLTEGQTLFIPSGWIHAVFTPVDSLAFGGNFLHSLNIPLQLQIHEMERRICTPEERTFPSFEVVHWFAAPHILGQLRDFNANKTELQHLVRGAKALVAVLKSWSTDVQNHQKSIPPGTNVRKLIKDLRREVKIAKNISKMENVHVDEKRTLSPARVDEHNCENKPCEMAQSLIYHLVDEAFLDNIIEKYSQKRVEAKSGNKNLPLSPKSKPVEIVPSSSQINTKSNDKIVVKRRKQVRKIKESELFKNYALVYRYFIPVPNIYAKWTDSGWESEIRMWKRRLRAAVK